MPSWDEAEAGRAQFADLEIVTSENGRSTGPNIDIDPAWDDVTKLRWQAATVEAETGIKIYVHRYEHDTGDTFSLNVGRSSIGDAPMHQCWTYLNGVRTGALAYVDIVE